MKAVRLIKIVICVLVLAIAGYLLTREFNPEVGQDGKDVQWVPTSQALVNKMLELAKAMPGDYVIDLGSGDGRTVITAAKLGIKALGIEYNPDLVELSKRNAAKEGVADRANFIKADVFEADFSPATVITMFLLPEVNLKLRPKILALRPGTRIVSNTFNMGEWEPDETSTTPVVTTSSEAGSVKFRTALLWIVPAKVDGIWRSESGDITIKQKFQKFSAYMNTSGVVTQVTDGKLRGDQISFSIGRTLYAGKVANDTITGTATADGASVQWRAIRAK